MTTTLVVFGVSGDLAARKLMPALYWLLAENKLPPDFHLIGAARREVTVDGLIDKTKQYVGDSADPAVLERLRSLMQVIRMDSGDADDYEQLKTALGTIEEGAGDANRLFYLSVPPTVAGKVVNAFKTVGLNDVPNITTRLLMEKPFGDDLASAKELAGHLHGAFKEEQIYRIDHYVAKEIAQNLTALRFHNPILEALWNHEYIERIEIEASEKIGIEGRVDFYEQTGALRDLIQSHLLALMALATMEPPADDAPASLHEARAQVIRAVTPFNAATVTKAALRGQYDVYKEEVGKPDSFVETYARLELQIDNDRWRGIPIIVQTGKGLDAKRSEIRIFFKSGAPAAPDRLSFVLAPDEGITLQLAGKQPGLSHILAPLELAYKPKEGRQADSYERVLFEAIAGDQTNFTSNDEVLATWEVVEPVLQAWLRDGEGLRIYPFGSNGPA